MWQVSPQELLTVGGTIRRYSGNPAVKWLGFGVVLVQAADLLYQAYEVFLEEIPECFCSSQAQGIWIGEREETARGLLGNAAGVLTSGLGLMTGPVGSRVINLLSPIVNFGVNQFTPDSFVRVVAKTDDPPPAFAGCNDPLGLGYERN